MPDKSVVLIWSRFGPYHMARIRAAASRLMTHGMTVHAIQVTSTDAVYDWLPQQDAFGFNCHTLFPDKAYQNVPARKIKQRINHRLSHISPCAVATNGWRPIEARAALAWSRSHAVSAVLIRSVFLQDLRQGKLL